MAIASIIALVVIGVPAFGQNLHRCVDLTELAIGLRWLRLADGSGGLARVVDNAPRTLPILAAKYNLRVSIF